MKRLLAYLFAAALSLAPALSAPQGTVNLASPSGTVSMGGDGTNLLAGSVLCGAASGATLWAVCANQAFVDSTGHLGVTIGNSTIAVTQSTSPWVDSVTTWGGSTLGAASNYGTSPGAVLVPGVNAFVTNVPAVSQSGTWTVGQTSPYPATAVPLTASATGTTGATTATLTAVSGHTTYICGFSIRANATAAATGNATVTGTITGTLNFTQWTAPLASGLGVTEEAFVPCIPASAVTTNIAVISAAPGTGGVVSVTAWGYSI